MDKLDMEGIHKKAADIIKRHLTIHQPNHLKTVIQSPIRTSGHVNDKDICMHAYGLPPSSLFDLHYLYMRLSRFWLGRMHLCKG